MIALSDKKGLPEWISGESGCGYKESEDWRETETEKETERQREKKGTRRERRDIGQTKHPHQLADSIFVVLFENQEGNPTQALGRVELFVSICRMWLTLCYHY